MFEDFKGKLYHAITILIIIFKISLQKYNLNTNLSKNTCLWDMKWSTTNCFTVRDIYCQRGMSQSTRINSERQVFLWSIVMCRGQPSIMWINRKSLLKTYLQSGMSLSHYWVWRRDGGRRVHLSSAAGMRSQHPLLHHWLCCRVHHSKPSVSTN